MLSSDMNDYLKQYTDAVNAREQKEIEAIQKLELEDIQFEIKEDPNTYKVNFFLCGMMLLLSFRIGGKYILRSAYREPSVFSLVMQVLLGLAVVLVIFACIIEPIIKKNAPMPRVKNGILHYKDNSYHYKQITMIKISSMNRLTVYVAHKKVFTITKTCLNYGSLIGWGRKCGITIFREPPFELSIGTVIIIAVVTFLTIMFIVLGPLVLR